MRTSDYIPFVNLKTMYEVTVEGSKNGFEAILYSGLTCGTTVCSYSISGYVHDAATLHMHMHLSIPICMWAVVLIEGWKLEAGQKS